MLEFEKFYEAFKDYLSSSYLDSKLKNTLSLFAKGRWSFNNDTTNEAPASIQTVSREISFNPVLIGEMLYNLRAELKLVDSDDKLTFDYSYYYNLVEYIKTFLLLHEIGHWLYTANPQDVVPLAQKYCKEFPLELAMYLYNVVEDSIIQRLFMLEYRGSFYRKCFDIGICCFQGAEAVKSYVSNAEASNFSIRTKLFYFIIRAYNLHNSEVQAMFNIPEKIGWSEATLNAFDTAITTIDKLDRARYCMEVLAPLVFQDLLEHIDESGDGRTTGGSLLDQGKLYTNDEDTQSSGSDSSSDKDSKSSSSSSESSEFNNSEESNKSQESDRPEESTGEEEQTNSEDESQSEESSKTSSESTDSDNKPEEKSLEEKIIEACKDLNKSINAKDNPNEVSTPPSLKEQTNTLATGCNVLDHSPNISSNHSSKMNSLTMNAYSNALNVLDKIFTMSNTTIRGLDQGELDEDELYTYYTEKNLNIYMQENKIKQDKKVAVYFVLDNSGSMDRSNRFTYSSAAFVGLIHALEDIQIKCCLLSFGAEVRLIKKFEDPVSFLGNESPLQYMINTHVADLEDDTNLFPALEYIVNDDTFLSSDPDLCKVVIIATDGATTRSEACAELAQQISANALVFGVGLDMNGYEQYLSEVMPGAIIRIYSGTNIATQLPEDIYEEIINRFLLY